MAKIYKSVIFLSFLFLILGAFPVLASAANLSVSPVSGTYEVGDRVIVKAIVSSSTPINAVSGVLSIPTSIFVIESVSKAGSLLNFWVTEPNFSKGAGALSFEGVTLGGFPGGTKSVVTVTLRAVAVGTGDISYKSGQVLANDGEGTDVTSGMSGGTYSVIPKKEITPKPEPEKETVEPDIPQPPPTLAPPEIVLTKKFGEQAVSGTSEYPNSQVLLTFISNDGVKIFITGTTDADGEFLMLVPRTLVRGTYKVSAIVIDNDVSYSHASNEIEIKVGNFFSDISIEIRIALILLALILLYLIVRGYMYLRKNKKIIFFLRREGKKTESIVHKSFEVLKEDEEEASSKKSGGATKDHAKTMQRDFEDAEEAIIKEIKDIEKL